MLGAVLALVLLIGFIAGFVRGFVRVHTWAGEYLVSSLLTLTVSVILNKLGVPVIAAGAVTVVVAIALLLLCMWLSNIFKSLIQKSFDKRDEDLSNYGGVGVFNRIWGGVVVAIKAVTILLFIVVPALIVLDFAQISALQPILSPVYDSAFWYALKPVAFDLIVLGVMNLAIRHGFSKGVVTSLWTLLVLAFIVGAGILSYHLVFNSGLFNSAAAALTSKVVGWVGDIEMLKNITEVIARVIITVGLFALLFIVIIVVAFFMSRVISFARFSDGFYVADGILGAIVLLLLAVALMLFLGYLIQPLYGLDFMQPLDSYFQPGAVSSYFYKNNLLVEMGVPVLIPIRDWLS